MHLTTVRLNGEFSASYDSFVLETRPNAKPENVDKKSVLVRRFFCCFSFLSVFILDADGSMRDGFQAFFWNRQA